MRILCLPGLLLVCLSSNVALALDLPRLPEGLPTDRIRVRIPGLDQVLKEKPALTTSLDDAKLEVPFLDDFNPASAAPLTEVPYDYEQGWPLVMGGVAEHWAQSYCLHAGRYGPGGGDGYLDAPLAGPLASIIQTVLENSVRHLDVPQRQVQQLIWSILARSRISDLSTELQQAARILLTPEQIRKLDGGALAQIPAEVRDQVFGKLPPLVRMALDAEASLRELLASHADFSALEQVAVLSGDPPASEDDRPVPEGRWSFTPEGCFVRYFPEGYSKTRIQLYVPEVLEIARDDLGRLVSIADQAGNRIETEYTSDTDPATVQDNPPMKAYRFSLVRLVRPQPGQEPQVLELRETGWTFLGVPSAKGRAQQLGDFPGLPDRYRASVKLMEQFRPLLDAVGNNLKLKRNSAYLTSALESLMDLAHYFMGISDALTQAEAPEWAAAHVLLVKRAWMTTLGLLAQGPTEKGEALAPWSPWAAQGTGAPLRLASLAGLEPLRPIRLAQGAWGGGSSGKRQLPKFKPDRRSAVPGNRGRQRLGQSGRSTEDSPGKQAFNRAREAIDMLGKGKLGADILLQGPVDTLRDMVGFAIPDKLLGFIIDWNMDMAKKISQELGGDPPRDDFTEIAVPLVVDIPRLEPGPGLSEARADAINAFAAALQDLVAKMRAAKLSLDRFGGATQTGDDYWAGAQASAVVRQKRAVGEAMLVVSDRLQTLLEELRAEGIEDIIVTEEAALAYQQRLRDEGFSDLELQAARLAGLTDEEIAQARQERLAAAPEELTGSVIEGGWRTVQALYTLGTYLASMGDVSAFGIIYQPTP